MEAGGRMARRGWTRWEWTRFLGTYHAKQEVTAKETSRLTLNTPRWVQAAVRRYNLGHGRSQYLGGYGALTDRRQGTLGKDPT